jgi:hypothetical protein
VKGAFAARGTLAIVPLQFLWLSPGEPSLLEGLTDKRVAVENNLITGGEILADIHPLVPD